MSLKNQNLKMSLPSADAIAHSERLIKTIVESISQAGGAIPFVEFMQRALYTPALGYYSAGSQKLGKEGDFITAPEISPLFSYCLANQCQQILQALELPIILEFGAGSGIMAADILAKLEELNCLPVQYLILEVSAELQQRQRLTLQNKVPHLLPRVQWLTQLPTERIQAVVLANEVLDAMPVHRFRIDKHGISEFYVAWDGEKFIWQIQPTKNQGLYAAIEKYQLILPENYTSEINLALPAWIYSVSNVLEKGAMLLIDYGFPRHEYYHPQRHQGTLMCHYRHRAHDNPLILIGLQDITAHIDFTAIAESTNQSDLEIAGYTNQANFLLACGLMDLLAGCDSRNNKVYLQLTQQIKKLILPHEMGEFFKTMALTKRLNIDLIGFIQDDSYKL